MVEAVNAMPHHAGVPVQLNVAGRPCLVVGGGRGALLKVRSLLTGGAAVTVVAPELSSELDRLVKNVTAEAVDTAEGTAPASRLRWVPRKFEPEDLDGVILVVAATGDAEVDSMVCELGAAQGALVAETGATSRPVAANRRSDFRFSASGSVGGIVIGVNSEPAHPALSSWIRDRMVEVLAEYEAVVEAAQSLRVELKSVRSSGSNLPAGRLDWKSALDTWMLDAQRCEDPLEVKEQLRSCLLS